LKTLLVDIDRAMLQHCLARVGGRQPLVIASSKAQAMQALWHESPFDIIVACERLEDGSGLALLDEVHTRWPHLVRVLGAEQRRLALLRTRLGALRLRHTLVYPLKPAKLELLLLQLAHAKAKGTLPPRG
jgi:DNA-binding NtrC family response regulator